MMNTEKLTLEISEESLQDIINIETGVLYPLRGFMTERDFESVVSDYVLTDGQVFTIPITLDVPEDIPMEAGNTVLLTHLKKPVAEMSVESIYYTRNEDWYKVFGTTDIQHPGIKKELLRSNKRIGGKTELLDKSLLESALKPEETKAVFKNNNWKTIVGFQTRNPIHKAHEYIQRLGLEICDGLFINPLTGWKKNGDFTQEAVMAAYETMIRDFYPHDRVYLAELKTQMRYAGPREAVFHAIIRRNLGCTHFIIGRDHAGVGGYYGAYEAHDLAKYLQEKHNLGIDLLLTREPYYCDKCKSIVTDRTCAHYETNRVPVSGTKIREYIREKNMPDETLMRKEILNAILKCDKIFIDSANV